MSAGRARLSPTAWKNRLFKVLMHRCSHLNRRGLRRADGPAWSTGLTVINSISEPSLLEKARSVHRTDIALAPRVRNGGAASHNSPDHLLRRWSNRRFDRLLRTLLTTSTDEALSLAATKSA
jgi:hypothetical protein